jgi:hypothetical protein
MRLDPHMVMRVVDLGCARYVVKHQGLSTCGLRRGCVHVPQDLAHESKFSMLVGKVLLMDLLLFHGRLAAHESGGTRRCLLQVVMYEKIEREARQRRVL